jgi:xanthine dehydrogenase accessory factor
MQTETLLALNEHRRKREAVVLVTELGSGNEWLYGEENIPQNEIGLAVGKAMRTGNSSLLRTDDDEFFINAHLPPARIVVIGAVHISQAMAPIARIAGFDMEIVDPRTAFASQERFPEVKLYAEWPDEYLAANPLDRYCALAAVTHDPKIDDSALIAAVRANCFYVGALGSRKTHGRRAERLAAEGLDAADIARIAAPIGLDIGASTPAEIAIAVMAQIVEAFRKRGLGRRNAAEEERMLDA